MSRSPRAAGYPRMRLGYPAINLELAEAGIRSNRGFILRSYSEERFRETVAGNLAALGEILRWNVAHGLYAYRISSDIVPFGGHPVVTVDWRREFADELAALGAYAREHDLRLSFHPGQYTLLNSPREDTHQRSVADLEYHCAVFDAMGMDGSHKVQIHAGGVYKALSESLARFVVRYRDLPDTVRRRLVIENDDFGLGYPECMDLSARTGVPVLLDNHHLAVKEPHLDLRTSAEEAAATWGPDDGRLLMDYSSQDPDKRVGAHAPHIDDDHFRTFSAAVDGLPLDLILEIKDKEVSAVRALELLAQSGGR
ncbi:UV DNA damage repair endonuclease UvsE [Nakamurella endophytica]|uniref:UV DNA damage endonuclease n=1 Tax=Nakamurella endophytica TaxID=1748367 RepID=A0A917SWA8_9ACTN|nr:UV DNA damage repair endonuclease UvsE [Nakamurella endophytica]GGM01888.1 UV DNA damage endonuclease [Nakamurella endophytica]